MESVELVTNVGSNGHLPLPLRDETLLPRILSFLGAEDRERASKTCQRWEWGILEVGRLEMVEKLSWGLSFQDEFVVGYALANGATFAPRDVGMERVLSFGESHTNFQEAIVQAYEADGQDTVRSALFRALYYQHMKMAAALAEKMKGVDKGLQLALEGRSVDLAKYFLKRGATFPDVWSGVRTAIQVGESHPEFRDAVVKACEGKQAYPSALRWALEMQCKGVALRLAESFEDIEKGVRLAGKYEAKEVEKVLLERKKGETEVTLPVVEYTDGIDFDGLFAGLDDDSDDLYG